MALIVWNKCVLSLQEGLSIPHAPYAYASICEHDAWIRPLREPGARMVFQTLGGSSFHETGLRAAFFSSGL